MDRHELISRALPFLLQRLKDAGIQATPDVDLEEDAIILMIDDTFRINIENLLDELERTDPAAHETTIERWVAFIIETIRTPERSLTDPNELRQRIRTRIIRNELASDPHLTYTRPFDGGLSVALCLDFPNSVSTVTDQDLEQYPLSVDELYHYGQINTNNEPIDQKGECGPFTGISGQSLFIASKAANIGALVGQLGINAPHGLFFALPQRSVLMYAPANPNDISQQIYSMIDYIRYQIMQDFQKNRGAALSKDIFYCAPDGEFGAITRGDYSEVQELFENPNIDSDRFFELAHTYLYLYESFMHRFFDE